MSKREEVFVQLHRWNRQVLSHTPHWVQGSIPWNAQGTITRRKCSTNPNDFITLGDCEKPKTARDVFRYNVIHGMLMKFPKDDVAWFAPNFGTGNLTKHVDALEAEFSEMIRLLRENI